MYGGTGTHSYQVLLRGSPIVDDTGHKAMVVDSRSHVKEDFQTSNRNRNASKEPSMPRPACHDRHGPHALISVLAERSGTVSRVKCRPPELIPDSAPPPSA